MKLNKRKDQAKMDLAKNHSTKNVLTKNVFDCHTGDYCFKNNINLVKLTQLQEENENSANLGK